MQGAGHIWADIHWSFVAGVRPERRSRGRAALLTFSAAINYAMLNEGIKRAISP